MQNQPNNYFDETFDLLKQYSDDRLLLLKIQTVKKTGKLVNKLIFIFVSVILLFFTLLFLSFMLAYFFAEKLQSTFYGFGLVFGIYVFVFIVFWLLYKNYFSKKVMDMITLIFFDNSTSQIDDNE